MKRVQGLEIPQTLEELCDPQRMALVVYDMQVGDAVFTDVEAFCQALKRKGG